MYRFCEAWTTLECPLATSVYLQEVSVAKRLTMVKKSVTVIKLFKKK